MAITRVNSASITARAAAASATATIPGGTGIQAGDLIYVCAASSGTHVANTMSVQDSVNLTPFTKILETQPPGSAFYQSTHVFQTPVSIADGSTITLTGFAAATACALAIDIFRGASAVIDRAAAGTGNATTTTPAGPALGGNATAGALVLTTCSTGATGTTQAAGSPFTAGSTQAVSPGTGIGFVLSATGSLTYGSTWTLGVTSVSATQTVSFLPAAAPAAQSQRPVISRRAPLRARLGRLGLCAAGIASTAVTPLGAQQPHKPPVPVTRPAPHRAHAGPQGLCGAGKAGPQPAVVLVTTAYQRPSPQISRRLPQRALWRGLASRVITPRGSPPSPLPRPVIQHLPPERARTGPAGRPWGGIASAAVTPLGSLQAPRRVVIAPPHNARARLGPAGSAGDGVTGPANAQAAAAVSPPKLPPQTRRPAPARGQWRGNASQIVTPLGPAARRPGPQITSRPRTRALWRGISGTIAPPVTTPPKWRPLPSRRKPQRARTGGVLGLANALPPVLQNATSSPTVTAGDTSAASATGAVHGASVTAQGTSAATATGQPSASTVTPAASSTPSASDG